MVSPEVVRRRLRLLEGYLKKLQRLRVQTKIDVFLSDGDLQDIVERNLQLTIEALLDIGQHIIASSAWEPVEEYSDIFTILHQHGILSDALFSRVRRMAGFRNLLVHGYALLDHEQVFEILRDHLGDLEDLASVYQKISDSN